MAVVLFAFGAFMDPDINAYVVDGDVDARDGRGSADIERCREIFQGSARLAVNASAAAGSGFCGAGTSRAVLITHRWCSAPPSAQ
jgi:hypothetical protein